MSVAATLSAAHSCARTLLFDSLCIQKFTGAIPHVMLVVDAQSCALQKVLLEGYRTAMEEWNGEEARSATTISSSSINAAQTMTMPLPLRLSQWLSSPTGGPPCGAAGLMPHGTSSGRVSYTVMPFVAAEFMEDMKQLQRFLQQCGGSTDQGSAAAPSTAVWSEEEFLASFQKLSKYLMPLQDTQAGGADMKYDTHELCTALRRGPCRELLAFVLIQRSAFQNELHQYRLRLSLFDRGMRVVEHCHLESMSEPADRLIAEQHALEAAVADDQIYSYCRSCAFSPTVSEPLAKAIGDVIDFHAWEREGALEEDEQQQGAAHKMARIPPSLAAALRHEGIWRCFDRDLIAYDGVSGSAINVNSAAMSEEAFQAHMRSAVKGVGAPLRILCRDRRKVLTFSGGMEDCLANTGFYAAALDPMRNDVVAHRQRFQQADAEADDDDDNDNHAAGAGASAETGGSGAGSASASPEVMGRMKKKEYLEMLRRTGQKPNKAMKRPMEPSEDEGEGVRRLGGNATAEAGSRMASSIGGTFPIGEVISESFDLSKLNGVCDVFAYPDTRKNVAFSKPEPFEMTIEGGRVVAVSANAPKDFVDLWTLVKQTERDCYVRELGIGLNPFIGVQHVLADVTSFERQWGVHLSLGLRHPLFVKQAKKRNPDGTTAEAVSIDGPVVKRKAGKYHIDVFVDAAQITCGKFTMYFTPIGVS